MKDSLENLAVYASTNWLKGEHANQMPDLLKINIEQASLSMIGVAHTFFYAKISQGLDNECHHMIFQLTYSAHIMLRLCCSFIFTKSTLCHALTLII